jgi:hypothetical protein
LECSLEKGLADPSFQRVPGAPRSAITRVAKDCGNELTTGVSS